MANRPSDHGVLHWLAHVYDFLVRVMMGRKEGAFRDQVVRTADLRPGEKVLDVGCGTGTLAIVAKRAVGPTGEVHGIDASAEMLSKAARKAKKAGADLVLKESFVQELPYPDLRFDVVLSTLMLHHLSPQDRDRCMSEMRRVLRPGGRAMIVDFAAPAEKGHGILAHIHQRHGHVKVADIVGAAERAHLDLVRSGPMEVMGLSFVLVQKKAAEAQGS